MILRRSFKKKSNKGWILIYVLIISSMITLLVTNMLGGLERKNQYLNYYTQSILKEDSKQRKKEYLMTEFNVYMEKYLSEIKGKGIDLYFKEVDISKYLSSIERDGTKFIEGCNIKYNSTLKIFQLNVGSYTYGFYPIINEDKITYKFVVLTN